MVWVWSVQDAVLRLLHAACLLRAIINADDIAHAPNRHLKANNVLLRAGPGGVSVPAPTRPRSAAEPAAHLGGRAPGAWEAERQLRLALGATGSGIIAKVCMG
jgi:hypothetical protein